LNVSLVGVLGVGLFGVCLVLGVGCIKLWFACGLWVFCVLVGCVLWVGCMLYGDGCVFITYLGLVLLRVICLLGMVFLLMFIRVLFVLLWVCWCCILVFGVIVGVLCECCMGVVKLMWVINI